MAKHKVMIISPTNEATLDSAVFCEKMHGKNWGDKALVYAIEVLEVAYGNMELNDKINVSIEYKQFTDKELKEIDN